MADEYTGPPIEQQQIVVCNQRHTALVYETKREGGRRIVVRDWRDNIRFDTLDCFDLPNATHKVAEWMHEQEAEFAEHERAANFERDHPELED